MSRRAYKNYVVVGLTELCEEEKEVIEKALVEQAKKEVDVVEDTVSFESKLAKIVGDKLYSKECPEGVLVTVVIMNCEMEVENGSTECRENI